MKLLAVDRYIAWRVLCANMHIEKDANKPAWGQMGIEKVVVSSNRFHVGCGRVVNNTLVVIN